MRLLSILLMCLVFSPLRSQVSQISNVNPRYDTNGQIVDAHDGRVIQFENKFYWYGTQYGDTNGFTSANKYVVYSSQDLINWKFEGELLRDAPDGVHYRPHIIHNKKTGKYILWYNWYPELWKGQFGVAVGSSPVGPFEIINPDVKVSKSEIGVGDLGLFVDDDQVAYISYNSIQNHQLVVERLNEDYTGSTFETSKLIAEHVEAGSMFRKDGIYYLLTDYTCCFCNFGSGARVYTASNPLGPYEFSSNINRYPGEALPGLTDGKIMGIPPYQLDTKNELVISTVQNESVREITIHTFTGNRSGQCGQVAEPRVHPEIAVPSLEFYTGNDKVEPVSMQIDTMGLRNKLTYRFEQSIQADLILKVGDEFPFEKLSLMEIEADPQIPVEVYVRGEGIDRSPIIPAQQSYVMELPTKAGLRYIWMGDLWGSAADNIKGHDFQYWSAPLHFNDDGSIQRMRWTDEWEIDLDQ
ncbi:MAG: family 43 glycosylhydrolase [Cyclobacteriaceae bacterium]